MESYYFYQDRKVTAWQRACFSIEAESEEEAKKAAAAIGSEYPDDVDTDKVKNNVYLYDSQIDYIEDMGPEENNGFPTIEIHFRDDDSMVYANSKKTF